MREILFRGKRLDNGKWIYGCLRQYQTGAAGICDRVQLRTYHVDPETVGQYTGLKDKNGKKIFEGDILTHDGKWPDYVKYGEWNCSCCHGVYGWVLNDDDLRFHEQSLEVAGNIHDNPELLKGE